MGVAEGIEQRASAFFAVLLEELYRRSAGLPPRDGAVPLAVIDDPATARHVLAHHEIFVKNYAFLEAAGRGRFSASGEEWRARAGLTREAYRAAHRAVSPETAVAVYRRHLEEGGSLDGKALFRRFVAAAAEVFSRALGLEEPMPWPDAIVSPLREALRIRQWIDWNGCRPDALAAIDRRLAVLREALRDDWRRSAPARVLLDRLAAAGRPIAGFDAAEELLQNVLASSETTASSLLWAAEVLSRRPDLQHALRSRKAGIEPFVDELLRMFPPVPYLTRRCVSEHVFEDRRFRADEPISISIIGLHRHSAHWRRPLEFDPDRDDFHGPAGRLAYLPFSRGERVCAGMRLAKIELVSGIEALLAAREIRPGGGDTRFDYGLASKPATALRALRRAAG